MFDRVTLTRDLVDSHGVVLGEKGLVISISAVLERARRRGTSRAEAVSDARLADDLCSPFAERSYRHLFRCAAVEAAVVRALQGIRLPPALHDELRALAAAGWEMEHSEAGLYLWASHPAHDSWGSVGVLAAAGILVAPGDFYGPLGARHIRVSFTAPDERIDAAAARLAALA
jgi:hypothetical protein